MKTLHYIRLGLQDASSDLLVTQVDVLRQAVRLAQKQMAFAIDTAVVLPNAFQAIWVLPKNDVDCAARWRLIKAIFARHAAGSAEIWQTTAGHCLLRDQGDYEKHRYLIVTAPVRAGLVRKATDWPLSSFAATGWWDAGSEPLPRLHQPQIHELLGAP